MVTAGARNLPPWMCCSTGAMVVIGARSFWLLDIVGQRLVDTGGDAAVHLADQQRAAVRLGLGAVALLPTAAAASAMIQTR